MNALLKFYEKPNRKITRERLFFILQNASVDNLQETILICFKLRDPHNGKGERKLGRICFNWLAKFHPIIFLKVMSVIPEYGRWDDLLYIDNSELYKFIYTFIAAQLNMDVANMMLGNPISNCAKWMPSENKSFARHNKYKFNYLINTLKISLKEYRIKLSTLRDYNNIVETKICNNNLHSIRYEAVPHKALTRNYALFSLKDEFRFKEWKKKNCPVIIIKKSDKEYTNLSSILSNTD